MKCFSHAFTISWILNRFVITTAILVLSACVDNQQEIAKECPQIGINVASPDFNEHHLTADTDAFYGCMISKLPSPSSFQKLVASRSTAGMLLFGNHNDADRQSLEFQWTLWKLVQTKQKTPEAAEIAWLNWEKMDSIQASQEAATAAANGAASAAANAQRQANMNAFRPVTCMNTGAGMVNCQ